jgi:hypothetical protein
MIYKELRSFNATGLYRFEKCLARSAQLIDPLDDAFSQPLAGTRSFETINFESAKALADTCLTSLAEISLFDVLDDIGLWAWLTYVLRDSLFKKMPDGQRKLGEFHRWYPSASSDFQKGQRHLVRMPVFLHATLGSNADHLLCQPPSIIPDVREQMTGQQDMITPGFQSLARALYFDDTAGKLKRGSNGKGAGSPRRLRTLRRQLDVTWQVDLMPIEDLLTKLPKEFERFL